MALNKHDYLKAIKEGVALTRGKVYGRHKRKETKTGNAKRKQNREADKRARKRAQEEHESITWFNTKRYFREHDVITGCPTCNDPDVQWHQPRVQCGRECFKGKVPLNGEM